MSITVLQSPLEVLPAYMPINLVASSSNAIDNYLTRLTIGSNPPIDFYDPPRPDGKLWRDLHRTIESFIKPDTTLIKRQTATPTLNVEPNSYIAEYSFIVAEVVNGVSGSPTGASPTKYAWGGSFRWNDFIRGNAQDYVLQGTDPQKPLTNKKVVKLLPDELTEIGWIKTVASDATSIKVTKTPYSGSPTTEFYTIGSNINFSLILGLGGFKEIEVYAIDAIGTPPNDRRSESVFLIPQTDCPTGEPIQIYYLNPFGRFDAFTFIAKHTTELQAAKETLSNVIGSVGGSGMVYDTMQHRVKTYKSTFKDRMTLRSLWLNDMDSSLMGELVSSPMAYAKIGTEIIPINIITDNWEVKYRSRNGLFAGEIEIEFGYDNYRQRL
jgi:hypothetical protein